MVPFYGQRPSSWRHAANPEETVLMTSETIDLMLELILHKTRISYDCKFVALYIQHILCVFPRGVSTHLSIYKC